MINRRCFLGALGAGAGALSVWPGLACAAADDPRLLVVLLRGGLDSLHAVPPYGDPAYKVLRGAQAISPDAATPAHGLDATFALHPSLAFSAQLYARGEFLPVVAIAPPYWGRSHFDAQDCVENGTATPHGADTGWLNRVAAFVPSAAPLAVASVMPLMMRGPSPVSSWSPPLPVRVNPVLLQRLEGLYGADPNLSAAFAQAIAEQPGEESIEQDMQRGDPAEVAPPAARGLAANPARRKRRDVNASLPGLMAAAARFLEQASGPRIAFVEDYGWDTHANQAAILARKLSELDRGYSAFEAGMGSAWSRTVVVTVTEFGRTAALNGTGGTDHGTGAAMFLCGGAVRGGRVAGTWPGLSPTALYERRDLHATSDLRAAFKGVLADHLRVHHDALDRAVFPGSDRITPLTGLVRS